MARKIKYIAVHCTGTSPMASVASIQRYWRDVRGWKSPGYHYLIEASGKVNQLLDVEEVSNGVAGFNSVTVNVSYVGGVDSNSKPKDTRTSQQKTALRNILTNLRIKYPKAIIQGHRDFPKVNKACPSFDAKTEYGNI